MQPPGPQRITLGGVGGRPLAGPGGASGGSSDTGAAAPSPAGPSFYAAVGGHDTFEALVSGFYARVSVDPVLLRVYPPDDWAGAAQRLMLFLEQYWGGPETYSETRGHPRLRQRHVHFTIDDEARVAWLTNMRAALDDVSLAPEADAELWEYLKTAAEMLVNTDS